MSDQLDLDMNQRSDREHQQRQAVEITPELIRSIADRVYAMLYADAQREHERLGSLLRDSRFR